MLGIELPRGVREAADTDKLSVWCGTLDHIF
jgi:hypothetical protein